MKQSISGDTMTTIIKAAGLTKRYGDFTALNRLDLEVKKGEILGYLGPNGAGKTTTIRLLLGLIKPSEGSVKVFDRDATHDAAKLHHMIAYVPGETSFWPNMTGAEALRFLANIHGSSNDDYQLELIEKFKFDPNKKIRSYSKGNRQKIALIAALASKADLLIFDEPTSGLDPVMAKVFRDEVLKAKKEGQTVFLSSHMLEEVEELCDRVAVLRDGELVELGTLDQLRHLSAITVDMTFAATPPDFSHVKNVSNVLVNNKHVQCSVNGSIDDLLVAAAKAEPLSFLSRKPSLEELFLAIYDGGNNEK
ncbi:MAG TPA: ABC transporter ATP-binding protein [Candidatus Chromulinivoraceae bacterium]|nr:ABC transporter ATP-binding protein [Candidatus Chromulinivoraceae bacterium]